ncbi:FecR family protein [Rhodoblastus sphagnicola]|nr:FecR domain-containing protein [Rhodoblastus sphagnicola]
MVSGWAEFLRDRSVRRRKNRPYSRGVGGPAPSAQTISNRVTMSPQPAKVEPEALKSEAYEWVLRLTSGEATAADVQALNRWRRISRAHRQAFAEANLLWDQLRPAAAESLSRSAAASQAFARGRPSTSGGGLGRRAFLGGALAASAAAVGYVAMRPPLGLWPSLSEMAADFRTGVGQQKEVALRHNVLVRLNTRSSIAVLAAGAGEAKADRVELISGEAAIAAMDDASRQVTVVAAQGETIASNARFNVRYDGQMVCVTCLEGDLRVEHLGRAAGLRSHEQIVYTAYDLGSVVSVGLDTVTAWERGLLVFRNDPLARVIEEVNRYRPGRIFLMNKELGRRPVLATFRIDRIDEVVPRLQAVFGVQVKTLPGGLVLLS